MFSTYLFTSLPSFLCMDACMFELSVFIVVYKHVINVRHVIDGVESFKALLLFRLIIVLETLGVL